MGFKLKMSNKVRDHKRKTRFSDFFRVMLLFTKAESGGISFLDHKRKTRFSDFSRVMLLFTKAESGKTSVSYRHILPYFVDVQYSQKYSQTCPNDHLCIVVTWS